MASDQMSPPPPPAGATPSFPCVLEPSPGRAVLSPVPVCSRPFVPPYQVPVEASACQVPPPSALPRVLAIAEPMDSPPRGSGACGQLVLCHLHTSLGASFLAFGPLLGFLFSVGLLSWGGHWEPVS